VVQSRGALIYKVDEEIKTIEMFVCEDVLLLLLILDKGRGYLGKDDLLGAEEGSVLVIEVHLLLVADALMVDPKILSIVLQTNEH
jgi:hypothetical protein